MKVVTVNGCFDVLHAAHVRFLNKARKEGDKLIVLINSDNSVKRLKGPSRPINNENDRKELLLSLKCVDEVLIFNEDTPLNTLKKIKPNIHVKGGSFIEEKVKEEKALVESLGGKIIFMSLEEGYSSTNIIKKIKEGKD